MGEAEAAGGNGSGDLGTGAVAWPVPGDLGKRDSGSWEGRGGSGWGVGLGLAASNRKDRFKAPCGLSRNQLARSGDTPQPRGPPDAKPP